MQQQKTYADNGMAQMLRESQRAFTKDQQRRGARVKAERQKIAQMPSCVASRGKPND